MPSGELEGEDGDEGMGEGRAEGGEEGEGWDVRADGDEVRAAGTDKGPERSKTRFGFLLSIPPMEGHEEKLRSQSLRGSSDQPEERIPQIDARWCVEIESEMGEERE